MTITHPQLQLSDDCIVTDNTWVVSVKTLNGLSKIVGPLEALK